MHQRIGKYDVIRAAGYGGFGTVYEGYDSELDRNVAIKICTSEAEDQLQRFEREARIVSRLQHPRIAVVYDYGFDAGSGLHYLVEEFLSGVDLEKKVLEQDDLPVVLRLRYLTQIVQGLSFVHDRGLIHRDLSSRNIRVLHDHSIKLMDFGLARDLSDATLTLLGENFGTVNYTAPEQLDNMRDVDLRTDIFSFGVIAYELLTYRNPYQAESMGQFLKRLHEEPRHIGELWSHCPPRLGEMIHRCLRREPEDRYDSCADLLPTLKAELEAARHHELPPAPPPPRLHELESAAPGGPAGISTRPGMAGSRALTISLREQPAPSPARRTSELAGLAPGPLSTADGAPEVSGSGRRWRRPAALVATVLLGAVTLALALMTRERNAQEPVPEPTAARASQAALSTGTPAAGPPAAGTPAAGPPSTGPPSTGAPSAGLEFRLRATLGPAAEEPRVELSAALPPGLAEISRCHVLRRPGWSFGDQLQSDCGGRIFRHTDRLEIDAGRSYSYEVYLVDLANQIVATGRARAEIPGGVEK